MINGYRERHGLDWGDPKLAAMDLQYHDVRPERSLYARLGMERMLDPSDGRAGGDRAPGDHPGLFPGQVPAAMGVVDRRGQLGFAGVRPRGGPAPAGADDGAAQRNQGPSSKNCSIASPARPSCWSGWAREEGWQLDGRTRADQEAGPRPNRGREVEEVPPTSKKGEELKAELDDLLDEIDEVLEENAEEFVRSYVQKGGGE